MMQFKGIRRVLYAIAVFGVSNQSFALAPDANWFKPTPQLVEAPQQSKKALTEQRYQYELAKSALKKDDFETYSKHYALLGDYPLIPYLDYSLIKKDLYEFKFDEIDKFFETNKDTFLEYRLREQLLHALAKKRRWSDYTAYYSDKMRQKSLRCFALQARIYQKEVSAYDEVADIWTEGKSQPKSCDGLFSQWRKFGGLTDDVAWTRFNNAMRSNKSSLARYVSKQMSDNYKKYASTYLEVHGYPGRIKNHRRFSESSEKMQQIIAHGIKRFARIDPKQALYHWELYEAQQMFPKEISTDTKIYLVKRLTYKGFTEEAESLIQNSPALRQPEVIERLIRESLKNQQFAKVLEWIDHLDAEHQASDRWKYWRARAQDELGITGQVSSAELYRELSQSRGFYGFLAADILNQEYQLENAPSEVLPSTSLVVESLPAMKRAKELWLKGDYGEAQAEWQFATKQMNPKELAAAGKIARQWGWYNKGIHAMIRGKFWDDLDIRFPLAYRETVEKVSNSTSVETTLIYAIARQESAFLENARSSAGAMGLMQLMPRTARQTARKSGIKHRDSYLYDPEYNINLGTKYLNELLDKFNGNRILAAAAYNAGPHRVNSWIKQTPLDVPFDVWIESIPFKETRGYVQNVLAFSVIYAYRLGQPRSFITEKEINNPL